MAKANAGVDEIHEINKYSCLILILDQPLRPTMTFVVCVFVSGEYLVQALTGPFVQSLKSIII